MARVLVTNGGPHPPEAWAVATAEHIMPIDSSVAGERLMAAKRLQLAIADALLPHHCAAQLRAQSSAPQQDAAQPQTAPETEDAAAAGADVARIASGSPWEAHFAAPEIQRLVAGEIRAHFDTVADIERRWWAHRNPAPADQGA